MSEEIVIEDNSEIVKVPNKKQSRRWCFTINNPNDRDEKFYKSDELFKTYLEDMEHMKYAIFSREKGEECGTEHFQGFIIFSIGKRFETVKNLFPSAHLEPARGSNTQARDYCLKLETHIAGPYELGKFSEQRERTDITEFIELIKSGADNKTIRELFPVLYLSNLDRIERVRQEMLKEKNEDMQRNLKVTYIYGNTGVGKSYAIHQKYKQKDLYVLSDYHRDPWYSYKGQEAVLMEEFRSDFRLKEMLQYLDIYNLELPARYSNKVACFDKVFIVSNIPLSEQYKNTAEDSESKRAFYRRIHNVLHFEKDRIVVEKCRDRTLTELRELLPAYLSDKLTFNAYEEVNSVKLPFSEDQQQIFDEIF